MVFSGVWLLQENSSRSNMVTKLSILETAGLELTTIKPKTVKPNIVQPTTVKPTTIKPTTVKPTTVKPTTVQPTTLKTTTTQKPVTSTTTTITTIANKTTATTEKLTTSKATTIAQTSPTTAGFLPPFTTVSYNTRVFKQIEFMIFVIVKQDASKLNEILQRLCNTQYFTHDRVHLRIYVKSVDYKLSSKILKSHLSVLKQRIQ